MEEKIEIFVLVFYLCTLVLCGILDTVLALKTRHNIVQEVEDKRYHVYVLKKVRECQDCLEEIQSCFFQKKSWLVVVK